MTGLDPTRKAEISADYKLPSSEEGISDKGDHPIPSYKGKESQIENGPEILNEAGENAPGTADTTFVETAKTVQNSTGRSFLRGLGRVGAGILSVPTLMLSKGTAFTICLTTGGVAGLSIPVMTIWDIGKKTYNRGNDPQTKLTNLSKEIEKLREDEFQLNENLEKLESQKAAFEKAGIVVPSKTTNKINSISIQKNQITDRFKEIQKEQIAIDKKLKEPKDPNKKDWKTHKGRISALHQAGTAGSRPISAFGERLLAFALNQDREKVEKGNDKIDKFFRLAGTGIGIAFGTTISTVGLATGATVTAVAGLVGTSIFLLCCLPVIIVPKY